MLKFEKNFQSITIKSFPHTMLLIIVLFIAVGSYAYINTEHSIAPKDILIFLFTPLAFVLFFNYRHLDLNKPRNTARLVTRSILRKKIDQFGLDEIQDVKLLKAMGSGVAANKTIMVKLDNGKSITITSSDAFFSNKETTRIFRELKEWLKA